MHALRTSVTDFTLHYVSYARKLYGNALLAQYIAHDTKQHRFTQRPISEIIVSKLTKTLNDLRLPFIYADVSAVLAYDRYREKFVFLKAI